MSKILFAGPGEALVCARCRQPLGSLDAPSDDGDGDFRWCEGCLDYVDSKVVKL